MNNNTAIFIDYDNVYIMLEQHYPLKDLNKNAIDVVSKIKEKYRNDKDSIRVFKCFSDFEKVRVSLTDLQKTQVELRHVYSAGSGEARKNASDIALAIDVIKSVYTRTDCDKYVLVSSDVDMLPIINELMFNGKKVDVIYSKTNIKKEYSSILNSWGAGYDTIEDILGLELHNEITEEDIKDNVEKFANYINDIINTTYNKNQKWTTNKTIITNELEPLGYTKQDVLTIIRVLEDIHCLDTSNKTNPELNNQNKAYPVYLINEVYISENEINLQKKIITKDHYKNIIL
ncbi:MAG: NYN domain-containing protein [Peptostreptococcaceae bacterium]